MILTPSLSSVNRIVRNLPIHYSIKFVYRLFTLDNFQLAFDLTLREYQKKLCRELYPKGYSKHNMIQLIDMFLIVEGNPLHIITDHTNFLVHINSSSEKQIEDSVLKLFNLGYILLPTELVKNKEFFKLKHYKCYDFSKKEPQYPISYN